MLRICPAKMKRDQTFESDSDNEKIEIKTSKKDEMDQIMSLKDKSIIYLNLKQGSMEENKARKMSGLSK